VKAYTLYAYDLWKLFLSKFAYPQHHIFVLIEIDNEFEYLPLKHDNDILYSKLYEQSTEKHYDQLTFILAYSKGKGF